MRSTATHLHNDTLKKLRIPPLVFGQLEDTAARGGEEVLKMLLASLEQT